LFDIPNMTEALIAAWLTAAFVSALGVVLDRKGSTLGWKHRVPLCLSVGIQLGAGLSIIGALQQGAEHGLVANDLKRFVILMSLLLFGATALIDVLSRRRPATKTPQPNPGD
jgi:hypothetical protein